MAALLFQTDSSGTLPTSPLPSLTMKSNSTSKFTAEDMAACDIENVLARFPATPVFDSMWDPSVLKHAYVMLARLLRDQNVYDYWEYGCILLGDDKAHATVLSILQPLLAMRNPDVPYANLITIDDGEKRFSMHQAHLKQSSLFVLSKATTPTTPTADWYADWYTTCMMLAKEQMLVPADEFESIPVLWKIPVLFLESAEFVICDQHQAKGSMTRRLIPFAIQVPVLVDSSMPVLNALYREMYTIAAKLQGVIQALSHPWHATDASKIRSFIHADTHRVVKLNK